MYWFLLFFLTIYGGMHAYLFWRVRAALGPLGWWGVALAAFLLLMVAAPLAVHALDRARQYGLARAVGIVGFVWMAVIFWFCVMGWLVDGWNLGVRGVALAAPAAKAALVGPRPALVAFGAVILVAGVYGWFRANRIAVEHVVLDVPALPAGRDSIRIAQITDMHLGGPRSREHIHAALDAIRRLDPDIVVSTGDMVDGEFDGISDIAGPLSELRPPLGKYAVFGNHEFYAGSANSQAFHEAAGFVVLRGRSVTPLPGLRIVGVDDPAARYLGEGRNVDESAVLPPPFRRDPAIPPGDNHIEERLADRKEAVVLLKHQPRLGRHSDGRFDIQLSGHTHGGQIFPFYFFTRLVYRLGPGRHDTPNGSILYVSRGTGTWGPPLRVASPPEVTLVTLRRKEGR